MKKKVSLSRNFIVLLVNIPFVWAHINIAAEIAQYGLEFIFNFAKMEQEYFARLNFRDLAKNT